MVRATVTAAVRAGLAKAKLRGQIRRRMKGLDPAERAAASAAACALLQRQNCWAKARSVLMFAPLPDELDIWPLAKIGLEQDKVIALPQFDTNKASYCACRIKDLQDDLKPGQFGIREPQLRCARLRLNTLDLV